MGSQWFTTMKSSFQTEWLALPIKESHQVLQKIALLAQDPRPDGLVKKKLKYMDGKLHRMRCGDFRIFYTYEKPYISLLALRRRNDTTYDEDHDVAFLGGFAPEFGEIAPSSQPNWEQLLAPLSPSKRPLPEPVTQTLLENLHVPAQYHARLLPLQTQEDLLDCPGVPDEILLKIDEYLFEKPLQAVLQQPDYLLPEVNDLQRYKDGDLLGFLLRLNPEQEKAATWAINASGPTQVKGKPGTGKSTVALYRVRNLLNTLRTSGQPSPRILFTTYTNALVESSRQLLAQLLGADIACVEVTTADKLVVSLLGELPRTATTGTLSWFIKLAVDQVLPEEEARQKFLKKLSHDYLLEEITQLIIARKVTSMEHYANKDLTDRRGRRVGLTEVERQTVWRIHEVLLGLLRNLRQETWQQLRVRAETLFSERPDYGQYDAVVVDEAQDLDPSVLRILIRLCKAPNRFFITADANQAIYRAGFTWTDVDESLRFQGRTTILTTNYRSTRQIGEAAQSYLAAEEADTEDWTHINNGQMPAVRWVESDADEVRLLASFLSGAARSFHLGLRVCAVFCPTNQSGQILAQELRKLGVKAAFMSKQEVNLSFPGVKVLTLHASKGLEFPIVALAGFRDSRYVRAWDELSNDERDEVLSKSRRLLFVGMTRAMHTLLLLVPAGSRSPVLAGFHSAYWNVEEQRAAPVSLSALASLK